MARRSPPVIVVCSNVAQAGRIAQGLGTSHGHHEPSHHHRRGPRTTRHEHDGAVHHHDLNGPRPTTGRLHGAHRSTAMRLWKVFHGVAKYEVQALGTRLEAKSEEDGSTVWRGVRSPHGHRYSTEFTTFVEEELESFLGKVRDGDQTTPGAQERPPSAHRDAPASATPAAQPPTRARRATRKPAAAARSEAPREERRASTSTKSVQPKKPKSKTPASAKPKSSKAAASAKPKSKGAASSGRKTAPKAKGTRQPAANATASGPVTSRSSGSLLVTPAYMRQRLHAKHPDTTDAVLETMEAIWRGGASEPTRAWMSAQGIPDVVDAFVDWVEHHATQANEYMRAASASRAA